MSASYHKSRSWLPWNWLKLNNNHSNYNQIVGSVVVVIVVVVGAFGAHFCRFLFYGQDKFLTLKSPASRQIRDAYSCSNQPSERRGRVEKMGRAVVKKKESQIWFEIVLAACLPTFDSINPLIAQFPPPTVAAERVDKCSQRSVPQAHTCNKIYPTAFPSKLHSTSLSSYRAVK